MSKDEEFIRQAIGLALVSENEGNPPVGAVITLDGKVISEGRASLLIPKFDGTRHAEMEALRSVPEELWIYSDRMSIYSTLEPCLMCFASILIHGIGRIVFGAADDHGGASTVQPHLPPYFRDRLKNIVWEGPIMSAECDPLYDRLIAMLDDTNRGLV